MRHSPDALALDDNVEILTYEQVDVLSNNVAYHIHSFRKESSNPVLSVGISLPRRNDMIIAMIGVLKAGAVYVPIDPNQPKDRKRFMYKNANCDYMICDAETEFGDLSDHGVGPTIKKGWIKNLKVSESTSAYKESAIPMHAIPMHDVACILHTSGSTGAPKGAALTHLGLLNTSFALSKGMGVDSCSTVLHYASLGFDSATLEWLLALTNGAKLVIIPEDDRTAPDTLAEFVAQKQITHALFPSAMLPYLDIRRSYALKAIASVGDVADPSLLWQWTRKCSVFNGYGPMEMSICTSLHSVQDAEPINLGKPIDRTEVLVVGENGVPVGTNEVGELWATGIGLSLGYVNNPSQTSKAFVQRQDGRTWYKTGDLVKLDPKGELHFVGRKDHQVKIRGNRIELEEVEQSLKSLQAVDNACVVVKLDSDGNKYLAAFLTGDKKTTSDETDHVRQQLMEMLPESHLPRVFQWLESMPLTASLKVDRVAIQTLPLAQQDSIEIANQNGNVLQSLFLSELGVSELADDDHFYQKGGDSIASIRLINQINRVFHCNLSMREFREDPSLSGVERLILSKAQSQKAEAISKALVRHENRPDVFDLSSQQLVAWYMSKQQPESKAYLAEAALHFSGNLNTHALEAALNALFARHDIYRTVFKEESGEPRQTALPSYEMTLKVVDADSVFERSEIDSNGPNPSDKQAVIERVLAQELPGISDLATLPLAKFVLIRFSPNEHVLLHQEHHIIHDGWSGSEFTREMMEAYRAYSNSQAGDGEKWSPDPVTQYYDFHVAQKTWLTSAEATSQLEYWKDKLKDCPQGVALFGKQSHSLGFSGGHQKMVFTQAQWRSMERRCQQLNMTPFAFTSAVLYLCLWRYSGQKDLTFGSAFANRNWQNSHGTLGMLVNTLVLRQSMDSTQCISDFLADTQRVINEAQDNQELPFTKIVEALNPDRSVASNPFFNVLLGFHDTPIDVEPLPDLNWYKDETMISETSKFDLDCLVVPRGESFNQDGEVHFLWEYRSDVYSPEEIAVFLDSFQYVFLELSESDESMASQPLSSLSVITPSQSQCMVEEWGMGGALSYPIQHKYGKSSIVASIEKAVQYFPHNVALRTKTQTITYEELDRTASQIAIELDAFGIAPSERVGIAASRSISLVASMLAVFKLGGCAVVIDPSLPLQRQAFMAQDANLSVLLFDGRDAIHQPSNDLSVPRTLDIAPCFGLDTTSRVWRTPIFEDNLNAYVLYTSGSTGVPKGVEVSQSAFHNECCWHIDQFKLNEDSVGTSLAFAGFDAFLAEVFPLLMSAGQVVLIDDNDRDNLSALSDGMNRHNVTHSCLPTGLLEAACASQFQWPSSLNNLLVGGDALGDVVFPEGFDADFYNLYGPTETTIDATFAKLTPKTKRDDKSTSSAPPIGRPIANAMAAVMQDGALAPIGVPGELFVGGAGVANGYLNQTELTQERFSQGDVSPFASDVRWYKTGDWVRWLPSGELEYLGRLNDEVKVRGYRVSLGEISAQLLQLEEVAQAAVVVRQGAIYAYVTLTEHEAMAWKGNRTKYERQLARKVRVSLKKTLPEYMRPSATLILDSLPLTEQGKLDKRRLPSPFEEETTFESASSAMEEAILTLWLECLELPSLSVTDNFFSIGGHSLLAMRMIARIRMEQGVELQMSDFFEFSTVRELASYIESILAVQDDGFDGIAGSGGDLDEESSDADLMEEGEI
ncbi:amino acid adenylation domain-containing protein [Vibrio sp. S9_S30]|uniref:non-ribosomal peptide synthetase n=1 Tax=Vibrio sp. S9_S30 TaxID=2720226 RepID=UPI0016816A95|nr:amino acid adenylation domain-containing protein [Vibrio sp. S9_S30]